VVLLFDVADVARARTRMAGDDLKQTMEKAGVLGAPKISFVT
jgi:hypothetical protein